MVEGKRKKRRDARKKRKLGGKEDKSKNTRGRDRSKERKKKKKGGDGVGQEGDYKESHCPETMNRNKEDRRMGKKGGTKRETVPWLLREVEGSIEGSVEDDFLNYTKIALRFAILFHMLLWLLGSSNFTDQSISLKYHMLAWIPLSDGPELYACLDSV
ncbi:unnamed protein product [Malus baccata var. baccata]